MAVPSSKTRSNLREPILDAAAKILREAGVKAVTQSRVARAAGIPQGHLTYYFPRRADLLAAVARRSIELAAQDLQAFGAARGWASAGTDLRQKALDIVAFMVKDRERTRMLIGLVVESEEDPGLRKTLLENIRFIRDLLAAVLGRAPDDPDVELIQATLWGLGLQHMIQGGERPDGIDRVLRRLPEWLDLAEGPAPRRIK